MPLYLRTSDPDFAARFTQFLAMKREVSADVDAVVRGILDDVRTRGDAALLELTLRFDHLDLAQVGLRVAPEEIARAVAGADRATLAALELARDRIASHHARQRPVDDRYQDAVGA